MRILGRFLISGGLALLGHLVVLWVLLRSPSPTQVRRFCKLTRFYPVRVFPEARGCIDIVHGASPSLCFRGVGHHLLKHGHDMTREVRSCAFSFKKVASEAVPKDDTSTGLHRDLDVSGREEMAGKSDGKETRDHGGHNSEGRECNSTHQAQEREKARDKNGRRKAVWALESSVRGTACWVVSEKER